MRLNEMLNSVFNQNNTVTASSNVLSTTNQNIAAQIRALTPGQILQGEVLESTGDAVKLLVNMNGEQIPLQARLEQSIALAMGKNLLFQVKNNGTTLSLSPLLENMGMEQNAAKALDSASIPLNENTLHMTTTLMSEGISIDRNTLQNIYHDVISNQNAELMDIIDLHKLGLPVTEENLTQLHSYKEMNHQLAGGIEQMAQDMLSLVRDLAGNGQGKDITTLLQNVLQLNQTVGGEQSGSGQNVTVFSDIVASGETQTQVTANGQLSENVVALQENSAQAEKGNVQGSMTLNNPDMLKDFVMQIEQAVGDKAALSKLVQNESFQNTLKEFLQNQFLLEPEAVADKEKVQDLFQKLGKQLNSLTETLNNLGQEQSVLGKTVQNLNQNVNFLNQMNQMYAYIQLPIKLTENSAHGELYVYSNKKHLASEDGEVSALLHLDMEHLGPVDVYVQMKDANVNTKFYLQDDDMLDFIAEHIDLLNERLEKRGYHMNCSMTVRDTKEESEGNVTLQELIRENSNRPSMVSYSFDVRA